jgi:hypothetical protein
LKFDIGEPYCSENLGSDEEMLHGSAVEFIAPGNDRNPC